MTFDPIDSLAAIGWCKNSCAFNEAVGLICQYQQLKHVGGEILLACLSHGYLAWDCCMPKYAHIYWSCWPLIVKMYRPTFYMGPIDPILHFGEGTVSEGSNGLLWSLWNAAFHPRYVTLRYRHFSIACTVEAVFMFSAVVYDLRLNVIKNFPGKSLLNLNQIFTRGRSHPGATTLWIWTKLFWWLQRY